NGCVIFRGIDLETIYRRAIGGISPRKKPLHFAGLGENTVCQKQGGAADAAPPLRSCSRF
ncbi:MAG: hypothetical protein ACXWLQ_07080, partial [Rhizomicrobium sp.]